MKIAFYGTKPYDKLWFEPLVKEYGFTIHFIELPCNIDTIGLAKGYDAICIFVNDHIDKQMIDELCDMKVKGILLRSAGYNHVDIKAAENKIAVLRVPSYSPEAVAEFALALLMTLTRHTHKAYNRTRDFNMSLNGLMGMDLNHKTAGVIGTGKIGQAMIQILNGLQMHVIAYDPYPDKTLDVKYVSLEELFAQSDVISLHCPLTEKTRHLICKESIESMKDRVVLVNTSRGGLIETEALIEGLLSKKIGGVGLDVYEEEEGIFYEDFSGEVIEDENLARLTTFPNVLITSHMGFFTNEALQAIAVETLENAYALENEMPLLNQVGVDTKS